MTRHALTPLMLPTSLQPPLTGPRDVAHVTVHRIADDDETPATTPKDKIMANSSPNQDAVLRALGKKSPADRAWLLAATKLTASQLDMAIMVLHQRENIVKNTSRPRLYGLPGTDFGTGTTKAKPAAERPPKAAPDSFAAGAKAREAEIEQRERYTGADLPRLPAPLNGKPASHMREGRDYFLTPLNNEATALPCRAIAKADGGAIILRGNQLTAELCAEELNVIHQLRG